MPSRRAVVRTLGPALAAGTVGLSGCGSRLGGVLANEPPVEGPCEDANWNWPTAGGDPGRTGRTDTAPPAADADVVDLLATVRRDGLRTLASASPAVADGTAYVPIGTAMAAIDLAAPDDGPLWVHEMDDDVDVVPAIACGVVLVAGLNRSSALDRATGEEYWRTDVGGMEETALAVGDETVYITHLSPTAVDIYTGTVQWTARWGDTLAVGRGRIYSTQNVNNSGGIFAHDREGKQLWHLSLGKIVGSATVRDETVWVADNDGRVYAIDGATGETRWSKSPDGVHKIHSGLAVRGEDLVVPAGTGERSVVLDATTGETRWAVDTGIVTPRPVIGEDWVALGRTNHGVTVYDRASGERRTTWSRDAYGFGTIGGLVPVKRGFVIRSGTTSRLGLLR